MSAIYPCSYLGSCSNELKQYCIQVTTVWVLDTVHLCLIVIDPYYRLITHYGDTSFLLTKTTPITIEVRDLWIVLNLISWSHSFQYQYILISVSKRHSQGTVILTEAFTQGIVCLIVQAFYVHRVWLRMPSLFAFLSKNIITSFLVSKKNIYLIGVLVALVLAEFTLNTTLYAKM